MTEVSGVQHTRRRSTFVQLNLFTGSSGEIAADMTYMRLSLQDGVTAGGWFAQKGNARRVPAPLPGGSQSLTGTDAAAYAITQNSNVISLPPAAAYPVGQILVVQDVNNNAGASNITVTTATSTEHIVGFNSVTGSANLSTAITITSSGFGLKLAALSTAGNWVTW